MKYLIYATVCFLLYSCELMPSPPDCVVSVELEDLKSDTRAYHQAVVNILEETQPADYRYFFHTFLQKDESTFMSLNIRNENYCFDAQMLVDKWDKLEGMRKVNGKSYPKELVNLKWEIKELNGEKTIVYQDMDWIID